MNETSEINERSTDLFNYMISFSFILINSCGESFRMPVTDRLARQLRMLAAEL
jgi:hypothetical protein